MRGARRSSVRTLTSRLAAQLLLPDGTLAARPLSGHPASWRPSTAWRLASPARCCRGAAAGHRHDRLSPVSSSFRRFRNRPGTRLARTVGQPPPASPAERSQPPARSGFACFQDEPQPR
jgi:hypothetical protein